MRTIACRLSMCPAAMRWASRCMFWAARLVAGRFLRLGLLLDDAGRALQLLPFFLDDAALHQQAGRDEDGEVGQDEGEDEQQQGREQRPGLPGEFKRRGLGGLEAARVLPSVPLLHLSEDHGFGDGGQAAALKIQGGRQALFQAQARLGEPGNVHRVEGLGEGRNGAD